MINCPVRFVRHESKHRGSALAKKNAFYKSTCVLVITVGLIHVYIWINV